MKWIKILLKTIGIIIAKVATLVVVFFLPIWLWVLKDEYNRKHYFQSSDRIERITGVALPKFKVTEYNKDRRSFTGEYWDYFNVEFKTALSDELFDELDKKIEDGHTGWKKEGNKYSFSQTWGNGMKAPKGENDDEDRFFSITLTRGETQGLVSHGMW